MTSSKLQAVVSFPKHSLLLAEDVLGNEIFFSINGIDLIIIIPTYKVTSSGTSFFIKSQPVDKVLSGYQSLTHQLMLRAPQNTPTGKQINGPTCSAFFIVSKDHIDLESAESIGDYLSTWIQALLINLEFNKFTDYEQAPRFGLPRTLTESKLISMDGDATTVSELTLEDSIFVPHFFFRDSVKAEDIERAIEDTANNVVSSSKELFIDALKKYNNHEYRHSLISSAMATEQVLGDLLENKIKDVEESQQELIRKKYNQIASMREALVTMGMRVPHDIIEHIAAPRNKVIHKNISIDAETAMKAMEVLRSYILELSGQI